MLTMNNLGDGSTLSLDFTTMGGVLDPRLTFSRASNATFVNSSGYVEWAGANLLFNTAWTTTSLPAGWNETFATGVFTYHGDSSITCAVTTAGRCVLNPIFPYLVTSQGLKYTYGFTVVAVSGSPQIGNVILSNQTVETVAINGVTVASSTVVNAGDIVSCTFTADSTSAVVRMGIGVGGNLTSQSIRMTQPRANPGLTLQSYLLNPNTAAGIYAPRFDYSPTNIGEPRGLLIEQSVKNFMLQSQALSGLNPYGMIAISIDGTVPDPMGGAETKKIAADGTTALHAFLRFVTADTATTVTVSIFAKKNGYKYLYLSEGTTNTAAARFNLETGVSDAPVVGAGYVSSKTTPYPNGWWRCEMVANITASSNRGWAIGAAPNSGVTYSVNGVTYLGSNNSNDGIYAFGWQVEAGSSASSYVPTGASQVTRAVDTAIIAAGTNFSSWYTGGTTGTFVSNWYGSASSTTARSVIATSDVDDQHLHMYQTASALTLRLADFGALATVTTANNLTANALTKGAFSYAGTATSLCLNGGTVATNTLGFSVAPTFLSIGGPSTTGTTITDTSVMLNNSIRTLKYYPTRLTDAQIKDITT
jgi:hypothetical protein